MRVEGISPDQDTREFSFPTSGSPYFPRLVSREPLEVSRRQYLKPGWSLARWSRARTIRTKSATGVKSRFPPCLPQMEGIMFQGAARPFGNYSAFFRKVPAGIHQRKPNKSIKFKRNHRGSSRP